jgi:type 1 glutamine amidotransferase
MKKLLLALTLLSLFAPAETFAADKKLILIAGKASHGPGEHEHNAGLLLFQKCLASVPGINVVAISGGWPTNDAVLADADAIVIYSDGGGGHPALQGDHLKTLGALVEKGVGFACIHYAVEPTLDKGEKEFLAWLGGCFEINWSVNPSWEASFTSFPEHPITRGVQPFKLRDEWYFNMRFVDGMKGVTPILTAVPPASTMSRPDGPHEGNPAVRAAVAAGEPQTMAWAFENAHGGRGFGFTGGHYHKNWADPNMRKLVLNAILWIAKVEVPKEGVVCEVTAADLEQNLDSKIRKPKATPAAAPAPTAK